MIKGSCLCREVTYSVNGELGPISHCHCRTCQKAHAAAFSTVARIPKAALTIDTGKGLLSTYKSSPHKIRYFCSKCGSQVYAEFEGHEDVVLRLGTLDNDPGAKPVRHIFVGEKAAWYSIDEQLEQFDAWPTA